MDVREKTVTGMAEYIEREGLMQFPIRREHCDKEHANEHFINGIETVLEYAESLPAADVALVVHARWERTADGAALCTACKRKMNPSQYGYAFCSLCGAKMDGGED